VNNVEATLALLKNGANKDMQDSKVSHWGPTVLQPLNVTKQSQGGISLLGASILLAVSSQEWDSGLKAVRANC
jgi:hypothetical protein